MYVYYLNLWGLVYLEHIIDQTVFNILNNIEIYTAT